MKAVTEVDFSMISIGTEVTGDLGSLMLLLESCERLSVSRLASLNFALSDIQRMPLIADVKIFGSSGVNGSLSDLSSHPTLERLDLNYCPRVIVEGDASDLLGLKRIEAQVQELSRVNIRPSIFHSTNAQAR